MNEIKTACFLLVTLLFSSVGYGKAQVTCIGGAQPSWSANGEFISFVSGISDASEIWVLNLQESNAIQILTEYDRQWAPSWSKTGESLAFLSEQDGRIALRVFDQGRVLNDEEFNPSNWAGVYDWSPSGDTLVLSAIASDELNLWLWNPYSQEGKNLTQEFDQAVKIPVWSNSGNEIAFTSMDNAQIWIAHLDDATISPVVPEPTMSYIALDWSPDDEGLLALSFAESISQSKLLLINVETGGVTYLIEEAQNYSVSAQWAPDGSLIAFIVDIDGQRDLWLLDIADKDIRNVTHGSDISVGTFFAWSPNSDAIAFEGRQRDYMDVWIADLTSEEIVNITRELNC